MFPLLSELCISVVLMAVKAVLGWSEMDWKLVHPLVLKWQGCNSQWLDGTQRLRGPTRAHTVTWKEQCENDSLVLTYFLVCQW